MFSVAIHESVTSTRHIRDVAFPGMRPGRGARAPHDLTAES